MFYSHEILTSRQYGVATIWLVATIGNKSSTRRVTRKAIEEVDVQGACGKILEPGAPIALRLQGNLLYGVSRVHNQQCTYLVTDATKIQNQMNFFFRNFASNQLDPEAGRTRPENLLIEDDPAFDPTMPLPQFNIETLAIVTQGNSQKTSSQMSPFPNSQLSGAQSPGHNNLIQLDIGRSSSSGRPGSPFGLEGLSSAQKPDDEPLIFAQDDDVFGAQGDWGLEIDENGNIVESAGPMIVEEEPHLPPLPTIPDEDDMQANVAQADEQPIYDDQGDVVMPEDPLPEAEAFPERDQHGPFQDDEPIRHAPTHRKRKLQIDNATQLSRAALRRWQAGYLENCCGFPNRSTSATQAKRNAMLLTFGLGIGNIGQRIGVPGMVHPLAADFSGDALFTAITGIEIETGRGRRRSASEAILDDEPEEERRVRPRLMENEEDQEQARAGQDDDFMALDDPYVEGAAQEIGREAEHPMSDHHLSSTLLPWNRGSSAVPGSSTRKPNTVQQGRDLSSPLGRRGGSQDIVRYSDDGPMGGTGSDDGFGGGIGSADSSFDGMPVIGPDEGGGLAREPTSAEIQEQNKRLFRQLDMEGHNFLTFVHNAVSENGERRQDEDFEINRKWLGFDDLFVPRTTPRFTAAQAFYHTLCLVTKGEMEVEQDRDNNEPFGAIWVAVKLSADNI